MELFVFELSYIGWNLLSSLTCGILGIVYVTPYFLTARAGFYDCVKSIALQRQVVRPEEFGYFTPPPATM